MRISPRNTLGVGSVACMLVMGCPVDNRSLKGISVWVSGSGGEQAGGTSGEGGDAGAEPGGTAGATDAGTGAGGTSGSDSGGTNGSGAGGLSGGSGGACGGGGGACGKGGAAGQAASGGVCTCGGPPPPCPDIDGNSVLDCDETLAENGSFNANVARWANDSGVVTSWRDTDAHAATGSGSLALEIGIVAEQDGSMMLGTRQCFPASGGTVYYYGVEISVPEDAEGYRAGFQLLVHDKPACSGDPIDRLESNLVEATDWSVAEKTYLTSTLAQSVTLRLLAIKPFRADPAKVRFDNVLVRPD
jgi:hypothetical protein